MQERRSVRQPRGVVAESISVVVRVVLWFAAITAALVLVGVGYAFLAGARPSFDVRAIPAWFLRLSPEQWIGLGAGLVVALLLVALPYSRITAHGRREKPSTSSRRIISILGALAVLFLYALGAGAAYHVSRALGSSRDWAIIHGVYSWVYVGFSLCRWVGGHWKQPLGKTLRQFLSMLW